MLQVMALLEFRKLTMQQLNQNMDLLNSCDESGDGDERCTMR